MPVFEALNLNVRFQYKADIKVERSERLLSSVSGHSIQDSRSDPIDCRNRTDVSIERFQPAKAADDYSFAGTLRHYSAVHVARIVYH